MNLYRLEYQAGWHDASTPLVSWCYVLATDPNAAMDKLQTVKQIHPDNVFKITKEYFLP
jgi:hypothetical protein